MVKKERYTMNVELRVDNKDMVPIYELETGDLFRFPDVSLESAVKNDNRPSKFIKFALW